MSMMVLIELVNTAVIENQVYSTVYIVYVDLYA